MKDNSIMKIILKTKLHVRILKHFSLYERLDCNETLWGKMLEGFAYQLYEQIDSSHSLNMMTLNALGAADSVIIPVQAQYLPAKCMTQLLRTESRVKRNINPNLQIAGILLTLVDRRTNLAKGTVEAIRENFGSHSKIYNTSIPLASFNVET